MTSFKYVMNDDPVCPHCNNEISVGHEDLYHLYDEDENHEIDCPYCKESLAVESHCKWTFSTYKSIEEINY